MEEKSDFYTLNGYRLKNGQKTTESMEDYLEMMYRTYQMEKRIRINDLASSLNVKPSSVSKMVQKLKELDLVSSRKYGDIYLTETGLIKGEYLLWRHNILVSFFTFLNKEKYELEQVEKIEHFIDFITLQNMEEFLLDK
ncbi:MAG: iron dependent repressor, metal binding and dimerization domain protein [Bacilli bacterium]|nr:iron dependent repressor, metal binding and dimerization domain protein [Bacilli bacterium]